MQVFGERTGNGGESLGSILRQGRYGHLCRRPPSPESPQPYVSFQPKTASSFPISVDDPPPLQVNGLPDYIRNFNQIKPYKLHILSRIKGSTTLSNPVVVRFTIPDVLIAFITLSHSDTNPVLITQTVTAFGPRERVGASQSSSFYSYSIYLVRNRLIRSPITSRTKISVSKSQRWYSHIPVCLFKTSWYAVNSMQISSLRILMVWSRTYSALMTASLWIDAQTASEFSRSRDMCRLSVAYG